MRPVAPCPERRFVLLSHPVMARRLPAPSEGPTGSAAPAARASWIESITQAPPRAGCAASPFLLGVLEGEGIGPEVVRASLRVLSALESVTHRTFDLRFGGPIGITAERCCGAPLSADVISFCREVFSQGGAVLAGPGGGRFVYDLRREFDLFCKLSPLKVSETLATSARVKPEYVRGVDIVLVRENVAGVYQGRWSENLVPGEGRSAEHSFHYSERQVRRILEVAARIATSRRGALTVVIKDGGIPTISKLWRGCGEETAAKHGVRLSFLNIDHAAYCLIQHAQDLDVVVAPNLFGDILADLGSVLLGSRGLSFSGNFSSDGAAVYQTNHGSAYSLVGENEANPMGQFFSLAMLLRESFGLEHEAAVIEGAVEQVLNAGWRTADLMAEGCRLASTLEATDLVVEAVLRRG